MNERKIVVPEGMLKAAHIAVGNGIYFFGQLNVTRTALEAALKWLAENPIVPTREWLAEQLGMCHVTLLPETAASRIIAEWQRRMFLAPPSPTDGLMFDKGRSDIWADEANQRIKMAYRDGLNQRESPSK